MFNNVVPSTTSAAAQSLTKAAISCVLSNALEAAKVTAVYPAQIGWALLSSAVCTVATNAIYLTGQAVVKVAAYAAKSAVQPFLPAPAATPMLAIEDRKENNCQ